jgi:uncharacterized protein YbjT (DUF2867 family)
MDSQEKETRHRSSQKALTERKILSPDQYCRDLETTPHPEMGTILVTGATGYIGGRLVPELLDRGYDVRLMVRSSSPELEKQWPGVKVVTGDALDPESLTAALQGIDTAYYLIHSLRYGPKRFAQIDREAAKNFRTAADANNVRRIIYLGGLGDRRSELSSHLRSRQEICSELMKGLAKVTALRAAIIIGSGSASFEMIEHLVRNVPVFFLPPWAKTKCQPIAIRNVVMYLVGVLETPETEGVSYDIGGPDILSYHEMLKIFAEVLHVRRFFIPTFFSNIPFYSYLASLLTPVPDSIIHCLLESTVNTVVCENNDIQSVIKINLLSYREAVLRALSREQQDRIYTRWSDAYPPARELAMKLTEMDQNAMYIKSTSISSHSSPEALFQSLSRIGGKKGWFNMNWLWKARGLLDRILMGVGTARGRRNSTLLRVNDVIDFWRVEDVRRNQRLLLRAEMKLPGRAWLEFIVEPEAGGTTKLSVKAYYQPFGFWGKLYWYACLPLHIFIFNDLIAQIERRSSDKPTETPEGTGTGISP